jgi:hypothetical protein
MDYITSDAYVSEDEKFRYFLYRRWGKSDKFCLWVMLNPSTADANMDDPTIRKCVGFSDRWGYESLVVVNLFAFRATSPNDLRAAGYLVGEENDDIVGRLAAKAALVVAAWGANAPRDRDASMRGLLGQFGSVRCLGCTKDSIPRHPLMLSYSTDLVSLV